MKRKPQKANQFYHNKICDVCAWSPGNISQSGTGEYYCYCFDNTFNWEWERNHKEGVGLKMKPCFLFHSIPSDMKRGSEFAKYFQNKNQIEASSTRSWISIVIAILACGISLCNLLDYNKKSLTKQSSRFNSAPDGASKGR